MKTLQPTLSHAEVEFLAEHSEVTILPNFQESKLFFLTVSKSLLLIFTIKRKILSVFNSILSFGLFSGKILKFDWMHQNEKICLQSGICSRDNLLNRALRLVKVKIHFSRRQN